jgi:hypothetical protein
MKSFHLPLALWVALIAFAIEWLPQLAPEAPWLGTVLLVLTIAAKCLEVVINELEAEKANAAGVRALRGTRYYALHLVRPATLGRMLFGLR